MTDVRNFLEPLISVPDFQTLPLAGDASSRKYFRVVAQDQSWVLMQWEPFDNPHSFPFLSVQKYFDAHGISVPQVLGFSAKAGLFLLEDLGDLTLERKFWEFQNQENILPYYQSTLDELIKIHSLSFSNGAKTCTAYDNAFSTDKLMWEFHYMKKHLIQGKLNVTLSASLDKALEEDFLKICKHLSQLPQVICHRDFHSRNVMIKHGRISIIDFQDARMGPAAYDLVSLFLDSYVNLSPDTVATLLDYYQKKFPFWDQITGGTSTFSRDFDLQALQRCLKACGSFASFFNTRDDSRYLKHIPKTLNQVEERLNRLDEFSGISEVLGMTKHQWQAL